MPGDIYSGRRVTIRKVTDVDADTFAVWANDPMFAYYQPLRWQNEDFRAHWQHRRKVMEKLDPPLEIEVMVEVAGSRAPIGAMLLTAFDSLNRKVEFSVYFSSRRRGRVVLEALHVMLHTVFERLSLRKLICHSVLENRNATSVLTALGFVQEGLFREELLDDKGNPRDFIRSALFKPVWLASGGPRTRLMDLAPLAEDGFAR